MNDQCQMLDVERIGHSPCLGWGISPKSNLNRHWVTLCFGRYELNPPSQLVAIEEGEGGFPIVRIFLTMLLHLRVPRAVSSIPRSLLCSLV